MVNSRLLFRLFVKLNDVLGESLLSNSARIANRPRRADANGRPACGFRRGLLSVRDG
jgi:hypothetical protein